MAWHVEDCAIAGRIVQIDASDCPGSQDRVPDSQARTVEAQTSSKFPAVARDGRDPSIAPAKRAQ